MITLSQIHKQFGPQILYRDLNATLFPQKRYGLIGPNGSGKTILVRMIAGIEEPDRGSVGVSRHIQIGYLPQQIEEESSGHVLAYCLAPFAHLFQPASSADVENYAEQQWERERVDVYRLPSQAEMILMGLGLSREQIQGDIQTLSGGFRMRVALAQLLLQNPDFLMLDEPTNHLDIDCLIWLERFLAGYQGGLLIISHDLDFLNRLTDQTALLHDGKLIVEPGSVSVFMKRREEDFARQAARRKTMLEQITKTQQFIDRFRAKATKATQVQSREKALEKLKQELPPEPIGAQSKPKINLNVTGRIGAVPVRFVDAELGYADTVVLKDLEFDLRRGDKLAIIGPNGAGKSTFLKALAGVLAPMKGERREGNNLQLRFFSQHRLDELQAEHTVFQSLQEAAGADCDRQKILDIAGAMLFSAEAIEKKVQFLSGGEKARVSLGRILLDPGNLILLDEPANHLDLMSVEVLRDALAAYEGTLVVVSHDETLIASVATRIAEVRDGQLKDFGGTIQDYRTIRENILSNASPDADQGVSSEQKAARETDKQKRIQAREKLKQAKRALAKSESIIEELEQKIADCEAEMLNPAHSADFELLGKLTEQKQQLQAQLQEQMQLWETNSLTLEQLAPQS